MPAQGDHKGRPYAGGAYIALYACALAQFVIVAAVSDRRRRSEIDATSFVALYSQAVCARTKTARGGREIL